MANIVATIELPFGKFLEIAPSLRQNGAKFYTELSGENRILNFSYFPESISKLLQQNPEMLGLPVSEVVLNQEPAAPEPSEVQIPLDNTEGESEEVETAMTKFLSKEELEKRTKQFLISLADEVNIEIPSNLKKKEDLVKFLDGKIPA